MAEAEALAVLRQAMSTGLPLHWSAYLLLLFTSLLAAGGGAWFGAYLKEKARNYATREDLEEVLQQLRKTTQTTEIIKSEISGDLWERQNRWTFKKDLYVQLLNSLGDAASAVRQLLFLDEKLQAASQRYPESELAQSMDPHFEDMRKAMVEIRRSAFVAPLVGTEATRQALDKLLEGWLKAENPGGREYLEGCRTSLSKAIDAVTDAAREDLRLTGKDAKP